MDDLEEQNLGGDTAAVAPEGTVDASLEVDPFQAAKDRLEQGTTPEATNATTQGEDNSFLNGSDLDPRKLPPEIQPIFKRMQAVYTKKFQEYGSLKEKADVVDRFYGDQNFARQTLVGWAAQNGYQIVPLGANAQAPQGAQQPTQGGGAQPPGQLVEAFKANLAPELQWMAEPMAAAMGQSMQTMLSPVFQQHQKVQQQQRYDEWERHADELRGVAPGWEEHEDVMGELFDFLKSDSLHHPKYGSKLEMLYNLATAKAAAIKQATDRVNSAAKNRVSSGRSGQTRSPSPESQIRAAKTNQDAWELAKQHALSQMQRS